MLEVMDKETKSLAWIIVSPPASKPIVGFLVTQKGRDSAIEIASPEGD